MVTVGLVGAGGNMGTRVVNALADKDGYRLLCVDASAAAQAKLADRGIATWALAEMAPQAEVVVLTVPDVRVGQVAHELVPLLKPGAMVICLDPAAPHAGRLPSREDVTYFVTHPAHPPVFNDETDWAARRDFFGSGLAKQALVCALMQGPEEHYDLGVRLATAIFQPVLRVHRVTVEQMALLEPAMAETVAATMLTVIRQAMDAVIARGVPAEAARDFLMGHLNIELAIVFDEIDWNFSEGAQLAIREAMGELLQPDWQKVFEPEHLLASVRRISAPPAE